MCLSCVKQMVNSLQHQAPANMTPEPCITVNQVTASPTTDPMVRKQVVQDLMAQMQGTYNFMQVKGLITYRYVLFLSDVLHL